MKPVLIDVDTGVDDALSIMLAVRSEQLKVLGITTVSGNVHVDEATKNTLFILDMIDAGDIPVARGMDIPMVRPLITAKEVHGDGGLGDFEVITPKRKPLPMHGVDFIIEQIKQSEEAVTLLLLGPLTNIATALRKETSIGENIAELVIMGGAGPAGGNVTPVAEFNIYVDPEAAKIVFESGLNIRLITWDATLEAWLTTQEVEQLAENKDIAAKLSAQLIRFLTKRVNNKKAALCDPAAVVSLIEPRIIETINLPVDVETKGDLTRGMTVFDQRVFTLSNQAAGSSIEVAFSLNRELFGEIYLKTLGVNNVRGSQK